MAIVLGAAVLFTSASNYGFIGIGLYIALWVMIFPVMAVIAFFIGAGALIELGREQL